MRDLELDRADAGGKGLGFETVGVALAGVGAFVGLGLERVTAFLAHGFIDEEADAFGEAAGALVGEELQNIVQEFRIALVGHFGFGLVVFPDTPTGNQLGPPSTSFSRTERLHPSGARLRSARYARLRSASPRRGGGEGKKDKLQKDFYTPLDSNDAANFPAIRGITSELYGGGPELRLKQEMLLGLADGDCWWHSASSRMYVT